MCSYAFRAIASSMFFPTWYLPRDNAWHKIAWPSHSELFLCSYVQTKNFVFLITCYYVVSYLVATPLSSNLYNLNGLPPSANYFLSYWALSLNMAYCCFCSLILANLDPSDALLFSYCILSCWTAISTSLQLLSFPKSLLPRWPPSYLVSCLCSHIDSIVIIILILPQSFTIE